jgi:hypothetical protein
MVKPFSPQESTIFFYDHESTPNYLHFLYGSVC